MLKNFLSGIIILLTLSVEIFSQSTITPLYNAIYTLDYKTDLDDKNFVQTEDFILMIAKDKTYFRSVNQFVLDSVRQNRLVYRGTTQDKARIEMRYGTAMPENILIRGDLIDVYTSVQDDYKFHYTEPKKIDWALLPGEEKINGILCRKAAAQAFGRRWTAFYTTSVPFPAGPYKFGGLPGLILRIYDEDKDYVYNLTALKKKTNRTYPVISYKNAKNTTKKQFFADREKIMKSVDIMGIEFKDSEERRSYEKTAQKMFRQRGNFIER